MLLALETNLHRVKMIQHSKYLGRKWFSWKVIVGHTDTHIGPIAFSGPPKWCVIISLWCKKLEQHNNVDGRCNYSHLARPTAAAAAAAEDTATALRRMHQRRTANDVTWITGRMYTYCIHLHRLPYHGPLQLLGMIVSGMMARWRQPWTVLQCTEYAPNFTDNITHLLHSQHISDNNIQLSLSQLPTALAGKVKQSVLSSVRLFFCLSVRLFLLYRLNRLTFQLEFVCVLSP